MLEGSRVVNSLVAMFSTKPQEQQVLQLLSCCCVFRESRGLPVNCVEAAAAALAVHMATLVFSAARVTLIVVSLGVSLQQ